MNIIAFVTQNNPKTFIKRVGGGHIFPPNNFFHKDHHPFDDKGNEKINIRDATSTECAWMEACEKAGRFVDCPIPVINNTYKLY